VPKLHRFVAFVSYTCLVLKHPLAAALLTLATTAISSSAAAQARVFESPDETRPLTVDLYGWVQPRFTYQQKDERKGVDFHPNPAFTLRRARLGMVARMSWARAQTEIEFGPEGSSAPLIDAFVVAEPIPEINVSAGQMRVPFSRQNMLQSKRLQLPDTAFFVTAKFVHDRDLGAMVSGDVADGRLKYYLGVFDGNEPGRGQNQNADEYFLVAGRLEIAPLGRAPNFEGDLRPLAERKSLRVHLGGGGMRNRVQDKSFTRTYLGADLGLWLMGASLYAELYHRDSVPTSGAAAGTTKQTAQGFNIQAGYFLPLPWAEEHLELVGRVQRFDPVTQEKHPLPDPGARDLDQSNPTFGYLGFGGGVNVFPFGAHEVKIQASYEVRNETKRCLSGQTGGICTGRYKNDIAIVQATAGF
jgi:hypothetical protein